MVVVLVVVQRALDTWENLESEISQFLATYDDADAAAAAAVAEAEAVPMCVCVQCVLCTST